MKVKEVTQYLIDAEKLGAVIKTERETICDSFDITTHSITFIRDHAHPLLRDVERVFLEIWWSGERIKRTMVKTRTFHSFTKGDGDTRTWAAFYALETAQNWAEGCAKEF